MKRLTISLFAILITAELIGQNTSIIFEKGILLSATVESFNSHKHRYDTCDVGENQRTICLIDGKIWFGKDQGLGAPRNQLTKMTIKVNGKKIRLDVSGMYNPSYTGALSKKQFKLESRGEEYILYGFFSDGAGTYTAHWTIVRGKSLRQIITSDEREFYWETEK